MRDLEYDLHLLDDIQLRALQLIERTDLMREPRAALLMEYFLAARRAAELALQLQASLRGGWLAPRALPQTEETRSTDE